MALILHDVEFSYSRGLSHEVVALKRVSLDVQVGELTLVVGATGSGKSTLMRLAAGLLSPDSGEVSMDGVPVSIERTRGAVGLIFQDAESQLFADTLLDDVMFGPRNLGVSPADARSIATAALESVGLDPATFSARSPFSLSGGEVRRAAIAGVLALQPRYLLADEPTAGLDARGRSAVRALLLEQRKHAGVVVVSHVAEEFLGDADRVVVLDAGEVAWAGSGSVAVSDPGALAGCGLRPPEVLEVQRLAAERGVPLSAFSLDPVEAARNLGQGGWA